MQPACIFWIPNYTARITRFEIPNRRTLWTAFPELEGDLPMTHRPLEPEIHTDFNQRLDYSQYLRLDRLLSAQVPLSEPVHHDEMLFIIQHQTSELWFKLIVHEIRAAINHLACDHPDPCMKILARVKLVQQQLFNQWAVLETLTPSEYMEFRNVLGQASGFQSFQYRLVEFLLGNKDDRIPQVFHHQMHAFSQITKALHAPSLYDEFLRFLARAGHEVPSACCERDWSQPYEPNEGVVHVFATIYKQPRRYWAEYALCERLLDVEESFQLWRFRHMKTVERIIGFKPGTGGSTGVAFLNRALELKFFPELINVRTML
jgi:tryptophan 2,3-dioxygenase